jgi:hypothetical protein
MRNLIDTLPAHEMQASIDHVEFAAIEPNETMTIHMRHARGVESEAALQHALPPRFMPMSTPA